MAVAVSAVLFFTLSYPVENTYIDKSFEGNNTNELNGDGDCLEEGDEL